MPTSPTSKPARNRVLILIENTSITYDRRVLKEAHALMAAGYTVSVISPAECDDVLSENLEGITVRRYRPRQGKGGAFAQLVEYATALVKTFWLMLSLARRPGFDVIQTCNPPDLFFLITWPFRLFGVKVIFDQHDLSPELYSSIYGRDDDLIARVLRWCERRSYATADVVIATNESYRQLAIDRGKVAPDRIFVVRNGPREGWPLAVAPVADLRRGRRFLVVYMGIMGFQDGVDALLEAIAAMKRDLHFTDATFALVGTGSAVAGLKTQAADLGIEELVDFCGWTADDTVLSQYLATADACVCPESSSPLNDHSTFIKVMEYMASGTPIVAFDLQETRVSAGDAAVYAPSGEIGRFAELVHEVLTDEGLRESMTDASARRLPALRWETQIPSLLAAYDRALA